MEKNIKSVSFPSTPGHKQETFFSEAWFFFVCVLLFFNQLVSVNKGMFKKPKEWS